MYLIDTHCHLNDLKFEQDLDIVITNAKKAGVKKFIVPSYDYVSSVKSLELSFKFPGVIYSAIGFHPYEAQHIQSLKPLEILLSKKSNNPHQQNKPVTVRHQVIAIGECGLDYHQYKGHSAVSRKDLQKILFENQCLLALKYDLPLIIHTRDAFEDLFSVLDGLPQLPKGVLHCFSGGKQDLREAQKRRLYVGIDCNITYSSHLQSVLQDIPETMILLETDSPYLPPEGYRGQRNEPKYLRSALKKISEVKKISIPEIADFILSNSNRLFFNYI